VRVAGPEAPMEQELARRARDGDRDAFSTLVRASLTRLYTTARLVLRDPDRAEDAVQEALIQAWRDLPSLRELDRLDAWLHRLLIRACYRNANRERRRMIVEIPLSASYDGSRPDGSVAMADRDELERAFQRLTLDQRAVLTLVYFADLSLADASLALGIPLGTTKSRVHHALQALRAALAAVERVPELSGGVA
jgi:RNA polymerase sigma-70 factor, ECF subfamily